MPQLLIDIVTLGSGVALLLFGGEFLVRGAAALAGRLGVAPIIIGLTVVAFGTSAPELALNIVAAANGNVGLSFGNIVGSNIANIGLILGLAAFMQPMNVHSAVVKRDLPLMVVATLAIVAMSYSPPLISKDPPVQGLTRLDGAILFGGFVVFLWMLLISGLKKKDVGPEFSHEAEELMEGQKDVSLKKSIFLLVAGLVLLVTGGRLSELGAVSLAEGMGLSQELIGLTVVAVATSLPELATSIIAARKGEADIAVGNVVGSNIFNILLVMSATSMVRPIPLPPDAGISLTAMCVFSLLLLPMSRTANQRISRIEGGILLALYFGLMTQQVISAVV